MSALSSRRRWLESGPRLNERASKRANDRAKESEKEKIGGEHRSKPDGSSRLQLTPAQTKNPLTWTPTLNEAKGGPKVWRGRTGSWRSEVRGHTWWLSFCFCLLPAMTENTNCLDQRTNYTKKKNSWVVDWRRDRREGGVSASPPRKLVFRSEKPVSGQYLHTTREDYFLFLDSWRKLGTCLFGRHGFTRLGSYDILPNWQKKKKKRRFCTPVMWLKNRWYDGLVLGVCAASKQCVKLKQRVTVFKDGQCGFSWLVQKWGQNTFCKKRWWNLVFGSHQKRKFSL